MSKSLVQWELRTKTTISSFSSCIVFVFVVFVQSSSNEKSTRFSTYRPFNISIKGFEETYVETRGHFSLDNFVLKYSQSKKWAKISIQMGYGLRHVQKEVHKKVVEHTVKDIIQWVDEHELRLWGLQKGRKTFILEIVYLTLFKYIQNIGFIELWNDVSIEKNKDVGFIPESERTLRTNIQKTRSALKFWASKYVYVRDDEWIQNARKNAGLKSHVSKCEFLIDSQDVPICKEKHMPPPHLDDYWSGKLGARAQRFMVISDFANWIHHISYGYSPKVYDSHWCSSHKELFDKNFHGSTFLTDLHFCDLEKYTNGGCHVISRLAKSKSGGEFTPSEEEFNKACIQARARCEQVFTRLQSRFTSLAAPWQEDMEAQEDVMHIAAAVSNLDILNKLPNGHYLMKYQHI
jgi:hypothetical protein